MKNLEKLEPRMGHHSCI